MKVVFGVLAALLAALASGAPPKPVQVDVDLHAVRYFADYGGVMAETFFRAAVLWARFDQPLFVRIGDNGTEPIEGASQGKLSGLARLQCGKKTFRSDVGGLIQRGLSLGSTTVPTQKLVPLSHFEDEESASLHLRTPGHTDHNVIGWMLVLDWADMAGEGRVIAPELLHNCALFLETAGLGSRSLSNRMGELAVGKLPIPAAGDMTSVEETNVYDMRELDSVSRCNDTAGGNDTAQPLALLEVNEMSRMLPGLSLILEPVISTAMKPIINTFASTTGQDIMETMGEYLNSKLHTQVPGDLAAMLAQTVIANVTNMATDAVTFTTANKLVDSLTAELGAYLERTVSEALKPRLHTPTHNILSKSIPDKVNRAIPDMVSRATLLSLTHTLTRSVTHALVPTLTEALTHTSHQDVFCRYCYYKHQYCNYCHYSSQSEYYNSYYSAYYSDFYSSYYALYYGAAVEAVDAKQHPASHGKEDAGFPEGFEPGEYPQHPWLEKS